MLHFVTEGVCLHLGINIMKSCRRTAWALKFRIPVWLYKKERYQQFDFGNILEGYKALFLSIRIRKRTQRDFPQGTSLWVFHFNLFKEPIGRQKLIWTREQLEDHFDATVGWFN